jgi:hypothetical protein
MNTKRLRPDESALLLLKHTKSRVPRAPRKKKSTTSTPLKPRGRTKSNPKPKATPTPDAPRRKGYRTAWEREQEEMEKAMRLQDEIMKKEQSARLWKPFTVAMTYHIWLGTMKQEAISFVDKHPNPHMTTQAPPCFDAHPIPETTNRITIHADFHKPLAGVHLPSQLISISFSNISTWNHPLVGMQWTRLEQLVQLDLSGAFNQSLDGVVWPPRLQTLTLGKSFRHPLRNLPTSEHFTELVLYSEHESIKDGMTALPPYIRVLCMARPDFFTHDAWPKRLKRLQLLGADDTEVMEYLPRVDWPLFAKRKYVLDLVALGEQVQDWIIPDYLLLACKQIMMEEMATYEVAKIKRVRMNDYCAGVNHL